MQKLSKILSPQVPLCHAYIVVGDPDGVVLEIKDLLNDRFGADFAVSNNPDFCLHQFASWGVDESRQLKEAQSRRACSWPAKVFVIASPAVSLEAQNSLLKTLEEPTAGTHFFLVTNRLGVFLPTIVSRCQVIRFREEIGKEDRAAVFLKADIADRFEMVKEILKLQDDDPAQVLNFLNELLSVYWTKIQRPVTAKNLAGAQAIFDGISYAGTRGSSPRIILEHLAGVIPTIRLD